MIAIAAFVVLDPSKEGTVQDAYLHTTDAACVAEKARISSLERETLSRHPPDVEEFASVLVTIVAEWRTALKRLPPPKIHASNIEELDSALLQTLIRAGILARVVREGESANVIAKQAQSVDESTANVDRAIERAGLTKCGQITVAPGA
ncbi:MAG TPA: hypothetical protein VGC49_08760 [Solirubrobacterales bacterium]|jgi:hypothetical protein